MSANFKVTVGNETITIKVGDKIEDVKQKFGDDADSIFNDVDINSNGTIDASEIEGLKAKIEDADYEIDNSEDEADNTPAHGNASAKAYNSAIQNLKNKYENETLKEYFKSDDTELHTVANGDTLYTIAKRTLESEGLPTDYKSINNRIAEIANVNNLRDVNNISVGTKLKVKLTEGALQKVKENDNDSVKAFTGDSRVDEAGENWTEGGAKRRSSANPQGEVEGDNSKVKKAPTSDKTSTITPTKNGLNMGAGVPVDKDGNELKDANGNKNFKDPKCKEGGNIMKYTQGDKTMFQTTFAAKAGNITNAVALSAPTIQELNDLKKKFMDAQKKLKPLEDSDNGATKKTKSDANLAAFKELIEITGGNTQVIKNIAEFLKGGNHQWVNKDAENTKAFVQDLILTRNADIVKSLTTDKDGNVDLSIVAKDKAGFKTLAGLYQEIRNKEKAGVKLTDEEVDLKDVLANTKWTDGFVITEANEEKHVDEKTLWMSNDGKLIYKTAVGNKNFWASNEKVLDDFIKDLKTADTDEKKKALFKKYANTGDVELANCLMWKAQDLHAADEDIKTVIKNNGVYVLDGLHLTDSDDKNIAYSKDVIDAMIARYKEIYTGKDKGNLENAVFLKNAANWIDRSSMSDKDKAKANAELAETYFDKTTNADNKVEYTFKPSRRPTKEEMAGLAYIANDAMKVALVNYEKYEDMGKGQYSEAIGDNIDSKELIAHRAAMVENMSSADDVIDFINNKVTVDKPFDIPFDKIMEKFGNDKKVLDALLKATNYQDYGGVSNDAINNDNRIKLLNTYIKNGKVDKSALPQGYNAKELKRVLPEDCKQDPAKAAFTAVLKEFGHSDVEALSDLSNKNSDAVKARLGELVKTAYNKQNHTVKYDFINAVCALPAEIRPNDELKQLLKDMPKLGPNTKANVFKAVNGYTEKDLETGNNFINDFKNRANFLRNGSVTPDNVVGIIKSLDEVTSDNKTGVHKSLNIDTNNLLFLITGPTLAVGKQPSMALCNRIPKALMRKAIAMELTNTDAYKKLEAFYGSKYDAENDTLTFAKNDDTKKVYTSDKTTQEAGKLIRALAEEIIKNS